VEVPGWLEAGLPTDHGTPAGRSYSALLEEGPSFEGSAPGEPDADR
jgi:hypothetical protein